MTNVNESDELDNFGELTNKPSFCYGCGQMLKNYSLLVCSECLSGECDKFADLASEELIIEE